MDHFGFLCMIFMPAFVGIILFVLRWTKQKETYLPYFSLAGMIILFLITSYLFFSGKELYIRFSWILPEGLSFRGDGFSIFLGIVVLIVWMAAGLFSAEYMEGAKSLHRYYAIYLITLTATLGTIYAGDIISFLLFFELASLLPYILIIHDEKQSTLWASNKYLNLSLVGGFCLLFATAYTYHLLGAVDLIEIKSLVRGGTDMPAVVLVGYFVGFGIKAAVFPLHIWLPEAHPVAPSPISAIMSGISTKLGVYGLFNLCFVLFRPDYLSRIHFDTVMQILAGITILLGSAMALRQSNLKKLLAYSTIGQIGYIVLGISVFSERALLGALVHVMSHAVMKSTMFLCAGIIFKRTGKVYIDEMKGIGYQMPVTMACFTVSAMSMIGIPPLMGFMSKWYLGLGLLDGGHIVYLIILLLSSLLNAFYFMPMIISAYLEGNAEVTYQKPNWKVLIPIVGLTLITVLGGLFEHDLLNLAKQAIAVLMGSL